MGHHDNDHRPTITALAILGAAMLALVLTLAMNPKPKTSKQTIDRLTALEQHVGLSEASK